MGQEMAALHGLLERLDEELGRQRQLAALLQVCIINELISIAVR